MLLSLLSTSRTLLKPQRKLYTQKATSLSPAPAPHLQPSVATILLCVSMFMSILDPHVNEAVQLETPTCGCLHPVPCAPGPLGLHQALYSIALGLSPIPFSSCWTPGLSALPPASVNSTCLNSCFQFPWVCSQELLGHMLILHCTFQKPPNYLPSSCCASHSFPSARLVGSDCSITLSTLVVFYSSFIAILVGVKWYHFLVLICLSLKTNIVKPLFTYL